MESSEITLFTADDIMTPDVVAVRPDTTIEQAIDLFEQHGVSGLPVVDDENRLLGMITEYDLLQSIRTLEMRGVVADFMTRDVITVEHHAPLVDIVNTLLSSRIRRVPVINDGKLVGVIARRDLLFAGKIRQQLLAEAGYDFEVVLPGVGGKKIKATLLGVDPSTGIGFVQAAKGHTFSSVMFAPLDLKSWWIIPNSYSSRFHK